MRAQVRAQERALERALAQALERALARALARSLVRALALARALEWAPEWAMGPNFRLRHLLALGTGSDFERRSCLEPALAQARCSAIVIVYVEVSFDRPRRLSMRSACHWIDFGFETGLGIRPPAEG